MTGPSISSISDSLQLGYSLRTYNNSNASYNSVVSARTLSSCQNRSSENGSLERYSRREKSINNLPRSSSREKKLASKISYMLKEQNSKINELNFHNHNKIKFTSISRNQSENANVEEAKIQSKSRKVRQTGKEEDKENWLNPNVQEIKVQSPPKLTLRQYFVSTPNKSDRNNISEMERNEGLSRNLFKFEDQMVLKEVRELKSMFIKLIKEKPEVKTRRKPSILNSYGDDSDKLFTLP